MAFMFLLTIVTNSFVSGQQTAITGRVRDSSGESLLALMSIKGTQSGTVLMPMAITR